MLVTIEEATSMWCPFGRVPQFGNVSNRGLDGDVDGLSFCLSYSCMCFRWDDPVGSSQRRGHCGLAGGMS